MAGVFTATRASIRQRIMDELERIFKNQTKGAPAADPYLFEWDTVQQEPLTDNATRKNYEMAIMDKAEFKEVQIQNQHATLEVEVEFSSLLGTECKAADEARIILTAIERKLNEDIYVTEGGDGSGGPRLALRVWTIGNEYDVDNLTDRRIEGVVFVRVLFKHAVEDPRARPQG